MTMTILMITLMMMMMMMRQVLGSRGRRVSEWPFLCVERVTHTSPPPPSTVHCTVHITPPPPTTPPSTAQLLAFAYSTLWLFSFNCTLFSVQYMCIHLTSSSFNCTTLSNCATRATYTLPRQMSFVLKSERESEQPRWQRNIEKQCAKLHSSFIQLHKSQLGWFTRFTFFSSSFDS